MATTDNERYLRYILLLGKGGPLVLKGIITHEATNQGKTLSQILLENNTLLRQSIKTKSQYEHIFPPGGAVNSDLDTWDTSLMCLVLLSVFRNTLTHHERTEIRTIRDFKNEIQSHSASLSLTENEFYNFRSDLNRVLLSLAQNLNDHGQIYDEVQDLIKTSTSGSIEISSTMDDFKEFQKQLLTQIKCDFHATHIKLDVLCEEIKHSQAQPRELAEADRQCLCNLEKGQDDIKKLIEDLFQEKIANKSAADQDNFSVEEDIETKMCVQSDTVKHASEAEDTLVLKINEILNHIHHASITQQDIRTRVQQILQRIPRNCDQAELTDAVLELILDIIKQPGTYLLSADKSCIRLRIRCSTYQSILGVIAYMESETFRQRLRDLANALTRVSGNVCSLIAEMSTESLQAILQKHAQRKQNDEILLPFERTLKLPVRCKSITALEHVWKLIQEGNAKHHFERISNALSKIVGGKITITTSVDLEQFKQALQCSTKRSSQKFDKYDLHRHATPTKFTKDIAGSIFKTKHEANWSRALSQVLDDLGLHTENIINKRRTYLLEESIGNISNRLVGNKNCVYIVGSTAEGATIRELNSDVDIMFCLSNFNVIQDYNDWTPGVTNLIMIHDDTTPPGHYHLQYLRTDIHVVSHESLFLDTESAEQLKNISHGLSISYPWVMAEYAITCLSCVSWPDESKQWFINKIKKDEWPSLELGLSLISKGCLITNTRNKGLHGNKSLWRISFSLAERSLMFHLNSTQIKCLVLMKMFLRTFIYPHGVYFPTSYMCKTVLLHCISKSYLLLWQEQNLLHSFRYFLHSLYICVRNEYCPHFFVPNMNLMSDKMSHADKTLVTGIMNIAINDIVPHVLSIQIGDLSAKLKIYLECKLPLPLLYKSSNNSELARHLIHSVGWNHTKLLAAVDTMGLRQAVWSFVINFLAESITIIRESRPPEAMAYMLLSPLVTTSVGSIVAASSISKGFVSHIARSLLDTGLNSDVASSRLKLASIFFCLGEREKTLDILMSIENRYDVKMVEPFCCCNLYRLAHLRYEHFHFPNEADFLHNMVAFCVKFVRFEYDCMPKELQYEMFKPIEKDKIPREENLPILKWAAVDSLPYLYFLQFKTYGLLGRKKMQSRSLHKLVQTIDAEPNLGHRETACNLVGQCYEEQGFFKHALNWYCVSLKIRDQNNAAILHICRVLAKVVALSDT